MNNLHPDVAENPEELVVYGGIGRAAQELGRCYRSDCAVTQGAGRPRRRWWCSPVKPVAVVKTHKRRPPRPDRQLQPRAPLGQLGAFQRARPEGPDDVRPDDGGHPGSISAPRASSRAPTRPSLRLAASIMTAILRASWILTAGLGGMGGAQPLAGGDGRSVLPAGRRVRSEKSIEFRLRTRISRRQAGAKTSMKRLAMIERWTWLRAKRICIGLLGNAADILP